jgi:hypothetical protein
LVVSQVFEVSKSATGRKTSRHVNYKREFQETEGKEKMPAQMMRCELADTCSHVRGCGQGSPHRCGGGSSYCSSIRRRVECVPVGELDEVDEYMKRLGIGNPRDPDDEEDDEWHDSEFDDDEQLEDEADRAAREVSEEIDRDIIREVERRAEEEPWDDGDVWRTV